MPAEPQSGHDWRRLGGHAGSRRWGADAAALGAALGSFWVAAQAPPAAAGAAAAGLAPATADMQEF